MDDKEYEKCDEIKKILLLKKISQNDYINCLNAKEEERKQMYKI